MKKYMVVSLETVYYNTEVEAETEEEACRLVDSGEVRVGEAVDSQDFQIDDAYEMDEDGNW